MTEAVKQGAEETPVIFRFHKGEVIAVFPCAPADNAGSQMTCYAHTGQRSACDLGWYHETRPARPKEYASLKTELESAPYGYRLRVYKRIARSLRERFDTEVRRLRSQ